ncbi:MAG: SusC/RagA family TonB-linked outer membrane protein [Sphingobacterium sp.]|jgi:TonB-linked SusC/RagA family outer membrane protein|nr:SusC/RagA family TonB-linked outer membrane protein [Sphingobacterium sp.]
MKNFYWGGHLMCYSERNSKALSRRISDKIIGLRYVFLTILFITVCCLVKANEPRSSGAIGLLQERTVTGKVTSSTDGRPLSGVSVSISGSTTATQTDVNGNYTVKVSSGAVLLFTYVGYLEQRVSVGSRSTLNVVLQDANTALDEVVVTALGISREKKSLGYATQEVKGDQLAAARGGNALQSLSGNVAGAVIQAPSSSLGGSTRIVLRGIGSLTGENRPLIVVDGIPMDNSNFNSTSTQRGGGGRDYGDAAFDINPDDVESVNVLKGGPASALYGSRAANGVILIKTKNAKKGKDEIIVNSGVAFEKLGTTPKLQQQYGGGFNPGFAKATINGQEYDLVDYSADESWGPRFDGQQVLHWDAFDPDDKDNYLKTRAWSAPSKKNNYKSFFETGTAWTNSVSLSKSYENTSARLSASNVTQSGIVPNSRIRRNTVNFNIDNKFSDKLTARGVFNYARTDGYNRPEIGYGDNSIAQKMFQWGQNQLDYSRLKRYKTATGQQLSWNRSSWNDATPKYSDNPYWIVNENISRDRRDRTFGNAELKYDILPGLYATGNVYLDQYTLDVSSRVAMGSQAVSRYDEFTRKVTEMNYEGRVHFDRKIDKFSIASFVGVNRRNSTRKSLNAATAGGLIVDGIYNLSNSKETPTVSNATLKKRVNSLFGSVSLGYDDLVYVDFSARNDWSSTLPKGDNSYFYPAVTGSFIFSKLTNFSWLNFGKVRAGWSKVGNDTDPYRLVDTYTNGVFSNTLFDGDPYYLRNTTKYNPQLRPEMKKGYEFGLEAQFLENRIGIDVTYYNEKTSDLIMPVSVGWETGYSGRMMNAGQAQNKGIEAMLTLVPLRNDNFEWVSSVNFSHNKNKVTKLYEELKSLNIVNAPFNVQLLAMVDQPYGQIYGTDFIYDNAGNKVVGANGIYLSSDVKNLGSILPKYNAGWRNTFNYKSFSLSALIDIQKGGKFYSTTHMFGHYTGVLKATAANGVRENGIIAEGVTGTVTRNADGSYTVTNTANNTKQVTASQYYKSYYSGGPHARNVMDADYVKLREVTFGYNLPKSLVSRLRLSGVTVTAFARNLFTWGLDNKDFDPEMATAGSGNIQGLEGGSLPASKTFGMNLKLQF